MIVLLLLAFFVYILFFIKFYKNVWHNDETRFCEYLENGFSESGIYGITLEERKKLKKQKNNFFILCLGAVLLFFIHVAYSVLS